MKFIEVFRLTLTWCAKWIASSIAFLFSVMFVSSNSMAAGLANLSIPATATEPPLKAFVWTPCAQVAGEVRQGPFTLSGVKNCDVSGNHLPLVVIAHGQTGSRFGHHDTAAALADAGFVVVGFNHPGDSSDNRSSTHRIIIFQDRPQQVSRVISYMLEQWSSRASVDPRSIGVFGFSRGGYTALALAGAIPSLRASTKRFCTSWSSLSELLCWSIYFGDTQLAPKPDPRVRAIIAADPLNLFDDAGLANVRIPVQLWASERGGAGVTLAHTQAIKEGLKQAPEWQIAKGAGHFVFLSPCPEELREEIQEICEDPAGIDRKAWHVLMNQAVVAFFKRHLVSPTP